MRLPLVVAFLLGLGRYIEFYFMFRICVADIICLAALPLTVPNLLRVVGHKGVVLFLSLLAISTVSKIASNIVNDVDSINNYRVLGWSVFFLASFSLFLTLFEATPKSLLAYLVGIPFGAFYNYLNPDQYVKAQFYGEYEKYVFSVAPFLTSSAIVFSILWYKKSRFISLVPLCLVVFLFADVTPRSTILVLLVVLMIVAALQFTSRAADRQRAIKRVLKIACVASMLAVGAAYALYSYAAPRGMLGEMHQAKYHAQADTAFGATPWGLVVGGRLQFLAGLLAVAEKPLIGHGTRNDSANFYLLEAASVAGVYDDLSDVALKQKEEAFHSIFLGEWAVGGILALVFWVYILYINGRLCAWSLKWETDFTPWLLWTGAQFVWDWLFSPMDMALRVTLGLWIALFYKLNSDNKFKAAFLELYSARYAQFHMQTHQLRRTRARDGASS